MGLEYESVKKYVLLLKEGNVLKKHISLILVTVLLLSAVFSFGGVAFASDFKVTPRTAEMASGGDVVFDYSFYNDSGATISDSIYYGSTAVAAVSVVNGDTASGSFTMTVTDAMLGQTLTFNLAGMQATAKIAKKTLVTKLAATPSVPRTLYGEGETVKFEFKVENQGETTLENIVIKAPEISSSPIASAFSLAPGESTTKKFSYTMAKTITVNPTVSYSVGGAAQTPYVMTPIALTLEKRDVKAELTASNKKPAAGEEVTFTLKLTNGGNVPYTNIQILANGEAKDFPSKLDAGGTQEGTFKMTFQTTTQVSCSISLKDHAGETKQISSNSVTIDLPVDSTAVDSKLSFTMSVDRPQMTAAGAVTFSGMITNGTAYELTNVKIDEATLGNIYTANTLEAGGSAAIQYPANIDATGTYTFVLTATDKDGNQYTKTAEPLTVTIQSVEPEATPQFEDAADPSATLEPDGNIQMGSIGTLGIIAIILVVLIIGVGVALVVLWKKGQSGGSKRPATPGRRPAASPARKKPTVQRGYRDRNNF